LRSSDTLAVTPIPPWWGATLAAPRVGREPEMF
jgi:hypothetical protein